MVILKELFFDSDSLCQKKAKLMQYNDMIKFQKLKHQVSIFLYL